MKRNRFLSCIAVFSISAFAALSDAAQVITLHGA